ncbi:MAG: hypothetical protein IKU84_04905 [Clostridia bacterium]|nr:hypothetical protein [Clostridia bacterium]
MERNDFIENIIGGAFAIVAVGAAIAEMFVNGVSTETFVACIKDVFGSLAIVVLFIAIVKDQIPSTNFKKMFDISMKSKIKKYGALIEKEVLSNEQQTINTKSTIAKKNKLEKVICYKMAGDINVLFGSPCNNYQRFLEIQVEQTTVVKFLIRKTFFDHPNYSDATLDLIGKNIESNLLKNFSDYDIKYDGKNKNIIIDTKKIMKSNKDAIKLTEIVDAAIMLYIAESKK